MANIYDVAREAGVSRSTVSRVINGKKEVNEETRQKIMDAMQRLNYSPNASARALALQKSHVIGVVAAGLTEPFFSGFIDGIFDSADEMGYGTLFCQNDHRNKTNINYFDVLHGKVDGIIFLGENTVSRSEVVKLADENYPVVMIESNFNIPGLVCVNIDNFQGAYAATRHLIQSGHKKIAHIMGRQNSFEANDRLKGFIQAMEDYGLRADSRLIKTGNFVYNDAYGCSTELLNHPREYSAVFCANDIMAAAFMHAAMEKGVGIPGDVSVIGFDDIGNNDLLIKEMPPLTTMRQPRREMAQYAVEALVRRIEEGTVLESKIFNTELVIRNSTIVKA